MIRTGTEGASLVPGHATGIEDSRLLSRLRITGLEFGAVARSRPVLMDISPVVFNEVMGNSQLEENSTEIISLLIGKIELNKSNTRYVWLSTLHKDGLPRQKG